MKRKTVGILAHVDAGKTTFSEQILYHTHTIRSKGRVDDHNAFLDHHQIERQRGITVFSDEAVFDYGDCRYYLVDTPGHVDFSAEMERALQILDIAILLVSAVEGVQGHTQTVWNLVKEHQIPCFFFINKIDREGADPLEVQRQIQSLLSPDAVSFDGEFDHGTMKVYLQEELAQRDASLLEEYVERGYQPEIWLRYAKEMIEQGRLFPCFCGSALQDKGIESFLQDLHLLTSCHYEEKDSLPFGGQVYKVLHDSQGKRVVHLKVQQGHLHVKDIVEYQSQNGQERLQEKVDEIRSYTGNKYLPISKAYAGELCAVVGLNGVKPGDGLGEYPTKANFHLTPLLMAKVEFAKEVHSKTVLSYLRILEDEDPMLKVEWNGTLEEIQVHIMGSIQLEILRELFWERFHIEIFFGECRILYQETITQSVVGYGHFEPLRHYAEVHLLLEPSAQGSGITFASSCSLDVLDGNYQRLIGTHVMEKVHKGVLTGSPLTDVKISLLTGRAHLKHTEGGDFREATYRAIRQGLMKATSQLLEPYYRYRIQVPVECVGRVLSDIQKKHGEFDPPEIAQDYAAISGYGPIATFLNYYREIVEFSKGRGTIHCEFSGYRPCHNSQQVIEEIAYEPEHDLENTPDSVFCTKGAGFPVKWNEVEHYIHCDSKGETSC